MITESEMKKYKDAKSMEEFPDFCYGLSTTRQNSMTEIKVFRPFAVMDSFVSEK